MQHTLPLSHALAWFRMHRTSLATPAALQQLSHLCLYLNSLSRTFPPHYLPAFLL